MMLLQRILLQALRSTAKQRLGITRGPDGALWFTEDNTQHGKIGRISEEVLPCAVCMVNAPSWGIQQ
jgi:streptogramin lyase